MYFSDFEVIPVETFTRLPDEFRRKRRSAWADINRHGAMTDSFLEGPCFDAAGNLYVTDIPFGRIFRISPDGAWRLVAEYDGWPNGLKFHRDGRLFIADYKRGIMVLDVATGRVEPLVETCRTESFKGVNDLWFSAAGDLYFTDQGQTGLHDTSGRVFRYTHDGRLGKLFSGIPSPNGIVLNASETEIYVAVTRANAVWRAPLMADGGISKVGCWIQLSGGVSGPDGLAMDDDGGIAVAHVGIGIWRFDRLGRPTHLVDGGLGKVCTNIALHDRQIFITESDGGVILRASWPHPGTVLFSQRP